MIHPNALERSRGDGWHVRVVDNLPVTFHPKLHVGGANFNDVGAITDLSLAITGSPNLSRNGFQKNGECVFWSDATHIRRSAAKAWLDCWNTGVDLTDDRLDAYERRFAVQNRNRKLNDMIALGVADSFPETDDGVPRRSTAPPKHELKAISETAATVAWAGLQSFTGEYTLQVEFPKAAARVLNRNFDSLMPHGNTIDIKCADGETRQVRFKFYPDNGMFRLNVPNSAPLVDWARANRQGIAYVEICEAQNSIYFEILRPGQSMTDILAHSLALGTWGRTPTRLYGWY